MEILNELVAILMANIDALSLIGVGALLVLLTKVTAKSELLSSLVVKAGEHKVMIAGVLSKALKGLVKKVTNKEEEPKK